MLTLVSLPETERVMSQPSRASKPPVQQSVHCEECNDRDYVPPSPRALAALKAGLESAKRNPVVFRREDFAQYADDE